MGNSFPLPALVVHADWGSNPGKRWITCGSLGTDGCYCASAPEPAGDTATLLQRLCSEADGCVLIGFDFPIGLPAAYAERADIADFLTILPHFGTGEWADFYTVAERPEQVSLRRPFYPKRPGGARRQHLLDGLGFTSADCLWRRCDRATFGRGSASPLFWTMGASQVGKAAIAGWRDVLAPALHAGSPQLTVWPFVGSLAELLAMSEVVAVETYPAECYHRLGLAGPEIGRWSKRRQSDRAAKVPVLLAWAERTRVTLDPALREAITEGFGTRPDGEDPFDAVVGLFGMLNVVLGFEPSGIPDDEQVRRVEGWILGL